MTNEEAIERLRWYFDQDTGAIGTKMQEAIDLAISALERDRWISVEDRLPAAVRKHYWICTDTGYQCECRWTNNLFGFGESDDWGWSIFDIPQYQKVVAWRPLPDPYEPPKEDKP